MSIECPCGAEIDVPLNPAIEDGDDGRQYITIDPDMADLWAHNFTHDGDSEHHGG
jgi:hypothetical protein